MYVDEAFWTVDTMFYSDMKVLHCAKYIFFAIKDFDFTRWDSGTGVPSMTASTLYNISLIKPNKDLLKRFDKAITPIFYKIKQIRVECEELTKQRDELLPLLMNGQVSVNSDLSACINLIIRAAIRICIYPNVSFWSYLRIVFLWELRTTFTAYTSGTSVYTQHLLHPVYSRPNEGWSRNYLHYLKRLQQEFLR